MRPRIFGEPNQRPLSFRELRERMRVNDERTILLICLGISLVFWFFVKMSNAYDTIRSFDLHYVLPPAMEFVEAPPNRAMATVHGTGIDLLVSSVFKKNPSITFFLEESDRQTTISQQAIVQKINEILSVDVLDVQPSSITIEMDSSSSRMVPIIMVSNLDFEQDYFQTDSAQLNPDSAMLTGAPEILAQITYINTLPLELSNIDQPVRRTLALQTSNQGLYKVYPSITQVFIPVEQYIEKSFEIPIKSLERSANIRFIPSMASLKCSVPMSKFDETESTDFQLETDFADPQNQGIQNIVPIKLTKAPAWAKSIQFKPKAVEYYIVQ